MNRKIKVAQVDRVFSYGGAEILLKESFASEEFQNNLISDLYVLDHIKLGLVKDVKPFVRKVRYYKITSIWFPFQYIKFICQLCKERYDVVHMHLPVAGWLTIPAKLFSPKTTFIYTEHNLVTFYAKYNFYLIGWAFRFFDAVIYVSNEVETVVKQVQKRKFFKPKKSFVILNGINTDKFIPPPQKETPNFTVGLVARFRPQKRVDLWVEVAYEIHKLEPSIQFLMVGDGPDDEMLRQKIKEKNLEELIQLPGALAETLPAYQQINIFLLTSDFEGLPLALLEAMSCGCIPVVSNVGGIKQLSLEGIGYKFDDFDARQIAEIIVGYFLQPEKLKAESEKARNLIVQKFSLHSQLSQLLKLYETKF